MEEIKACISSPQAFQLNINTVVDKLKKENDLAPNFIQFADEIFQSNEKLLKKYLVLMIIREAVYTSPVGSVTNKLASNNSILNYLQEIVMFQPGSEDEFKGIYKFENDTPQIAIKYFNLILELIKFLAEKYPVSQTNKPTKFKIMYDRLVQQDIVFPKQIRELTADINEIEDAVEDNQPVKRYQAQQMEQNQENGIHQLEELQIEMNDQIDTIWDMLNDQNCNPEGAKDMLQFYCDTFKESDAKLQQLEYELSDKLSQQQKDQIELLCNFIKIFNLKFNHFERNKTKNGFLEFQHAVLTEASKITKKNYTPSDAYQKSKIQPLSPIRQVGQDETQDASRFNEITNTQIEKKEKIVQQSNYQRELEQQQQQQQQIDQSRSQNKVKQVEKQKVIQSQQYNQYDDPDPTDIQNQLLQQQIQYDQQQQQKQYQDQQKYQIQQDQQKYQIQQDYNHQKSSKPAQQNNTLLLETDYSQFEQTIPSQNRNQFAQDYYQQPSKQEDKHGSLEQYQDQYTQKPQGMKLTFGNRIEQEQDQKREGSSQVQSKEVRNTGHNLQQQQYDVFQQQVSAPYPGYQQNNQFLDIFQKLSKSGYTQKMIDVWKKTCLLGKGNLFENDLIRVYCTFGLQFQVLNNKNYLKISLYILNKIDQSLSINIKFQGDKSTKFWIKSDNKKVLERELQYLIVVDECKELINCQIQIDNQILNVLLPTSQYNFIDFLDLRAEIFQVKIKDVRFYQSQPFRLQIGWDTFKKIRFTEVNNYYGKGFVIIQLGATYGNNNYVRVMMIEKNIWIVEATDQNLIPQLLFLFS
ncbi:unnamed protein product (macronuclear) [Paramecium tetraurelia]|uniref:Uncharacterized protein n=1 Tax=Paramecium tetraurelia TaxID=5888 RepID=A0DLB6_PARTE|nr:uncharacterized protein GSPATT00018150001 [Paramecium tetraurelia]CAK83833.1 unnamed protein product [Paramecium tetraurelia]|eukprot:XP_001451230.1 hypothetical protein (macronuclear) [Paramecium tetraurelia strain d4-2]